MSVLLLAAATGLAGCTTTSGPTEMTVESGQYSATFDAARHVLRDAHFDLERVDSSAGVITTTPKATAGLMSPWDSEQQTAGQEFEDMLQHHHRKVRITFEAAGDGSPDAGADSQAEGSGEQPDLIDEPRQTTMRVRVELQQVNRPNWRIDSTSIRLGTYAWDPALAERDMQPRYETVIADDTDFARRLVELIRAQVAGK